MITLSHVNKVFFTRDIETQALEDVSLVIERNEFVSIMGPSGCGKSTLLNIIGLLDSPTSGDVIIDGINAAGMDDKSLARLRNRKLGFIFQNFHLIPTLNVIDNVKLPMLYRSGVSSGEIDHRAKEMLEKVGLSHRMKHFPTQLSGGQCQRVAIARALIGNPEVLLADEPTGNLDSKMGNEILAILKQLNKDGATIVMVTHDRQIAEQTSKIVNFLDGRMVE